MIERLVVDEDREEGEDVEHVELGDTEELGGVAETPVSKFMTQHSDNLLRFTLLKQSIIDDDMLLPRETVEIGVGVGTALAAVDNMQLGKRELQLFGKLLNASLNFTGLKRGQLVEQRKDDNWVDSNRENLEENTEEPQVVEERVASQLNNLEHGTDNGSSKNHAQHLTLEHVRDPEFECLLIETELLLKHEGLIV